VTIIPQTAKKKKTLEQISQQIAREVDDDKLSLLISELQGILQAEPRGVREHVQIALSGLTESA
jgi:hypothetical protein